MRRAVVLIAAFLVGCDPCAGTPSCRSTPELSYTGQTIEFPSGRARSGVRIAFVRRRGPVLSTDTIRATTDRAGFFVLRASALTDGMVHGDLIVAPPLPHRPYTVRGLQMRTQSRRGDGGFLGRIMVNPFVQFIGELHDANSFAFVAGAAVTVTQVGMPRVEPLTAQFTTTDLGRFTWEPALVEFGDIEVEYAITATGYPRTYRVRDTIRAQYLDEPPQVHGIIVGSPVFYGVVRRRGTKAVIPGVVVDYQRTGGVLSIPESFSVTPDATGGFRFPLEIPAQGTVVGDLTIRPPPPLPAETQTGVELMAMDGQAQALSFDYGPATILRPRLVYRGTGRAVEAGTRVRFTHVGGLQDVIPAPWGVLDGVRLVDTLGIVGFDAATLDSGTVIYDLEVMLDPPQAGETIRIAVQSRRSDAPYADTLRVGLPGTGSRSDADSGEPLAGAAITGRRVASSVNPRKAPRP